MRDCMVSVSGTAITAAERQRRLAKVYRLLIGLARKRRMVDQDGIGEAASEMDDVRFTNG